MKKISRNFSTVFFIFAFFSHAAPNAGAAELSISNSSVVLGKLAEIQVEIDEVRKLAGVKLVLAYDRDILVFKKAAKTESTSSMLHVVNNKNPGKLIVVMAGAKGIGEKKFALLNLFFEVKPDLEKETKTRIEISSAELVGEDLANIEYKSEAGVLTIKQEKAAGK